jgi:hypothetical protein
VVARDLELEADLLRRDGWRTSDLGSLCSVIRV